MRPPTLQRIIASQDELISGQRMSHFEEAIAELKRGQFPNGHSIVFMFPQLSGLGKQNHWSAERALSSVDEARTFLQDKELKHRLISSLDALGKGAPHGFTRTQQQELAQQKLQACLTLFAAAARGTGDESLFTKPLYKYFSGKGHPETLRRLEDMQRGVTRSDHRPPHHASSATSRRAPTGTFAQPSSASSSRAPAGRPAQSSKTSSRPSPERRLAQPPDSATKAAAPPIKTWKPDELYMYRVAQGSGPIDEALQEIRSGRLGTDLAWRFFPQPIGFEASEQSSFLGFKSKEHAKAFMKDGVLAGQCEQCMDALLEAFEAGHEPADILGDRLEHVRASLTTLFLASESASDSPIRQKSADLIIALGHHHPGAAQFMS